MVSIKPKLSSDIKYIKKTSKQDDKIAEHRKLMEGPQPTSAKVFGICKMDKNYYKNKYGSETIAYKKIINEKGYKEYSEKKAKSISL
jgi:hypothetical protein